MTRRRPWLASVPDDLADDAQTAAHERAVRNLIGRYQRDQLRSQRTVGGSESPPDGPGDQPEGDAPGPVAA